MKSNWSGHQEEVNLTRAAESRIIQHSFSLFFFSTISDPPPSPDPPNPIDWDLTSLKQRGRAFWLALNPQKQRGSPWIWLWKILSLSSLCQGPDLHHAYLNPRLDYWSPCVTPPFPPPPPPSPNHHVCFEYVAVNYALIHWHTVEMDVSPSQSCRKSSSACHGQRLLHPHPHPHSHPPRARVAPSRVLTGTTVHSLVNRRPGQLVGQRVPALHLLALVLQTVYPVLQSVSLWVAPEGHASWRGEGGGRQEKRDEVRPTGWVGSCQCGYSCL